MSTIVEAIIRFRRNTASGAAANNVVLKLGEAGFETDTLKIKVGDGVTPYNDLEYTSEPFTDIIRAMATLTPAADRYVYFTSGSAAALGTITAFARTLLDDADAATARATLGMGTMATQAASAVAITGGTVGGLTSLGVGNSSPSDTVHLQGSTFPRLRFQRTGIGDWAIGNPTTGGTTNLFSISLNGSPVFNIDTGGAVYPQSDNTQTLGLSGNRWSVVYAGTGTINTSDARDKRDIEVVPDAWLDAWADVHWCRYKFKNGSRWHIGLVAQHVRDVFAAHGIDATEIGLLCYDEWPAEPAVRAKHDRNGNLVRAAVPGRKAGNRWGLRYDECQALESAFQRRRIDRLENALTALANKV